MLRAAFRDGAEDQVLFWGERRFDGGCRLSAGAAEKRSPVKCCREHGGTFFPYTKGKTVLIKE